jgi:hypothetical protein
VGYEQPREASFNFSVRQLQPDHREPGFGYGAVPSATTAHRSP